MAFSSSLDSKHVSSSTAQASTTDSIEDLFAKIESIFASSSPDFKQIETLLKQVTEAFTELEVEDPTQYKKYKYKYFMTYAQYHERQGQKIEADKKKDFAQRFAQSTGPKDTKKQDDAKPIHFKEDPAKKNKIDNLKKLTCLNNPQLNNLLDEIQNFYNQCEIISNDFEDFTQVKESYAKFSGRLKFFQAELSSDSKEDRMNMNAITHDINASIQHLKAHFVQHLAAQPEAKLRVLLFGEKETYNPENIKKTYNKLLMEFHPDKNDSDNASYRKIFVAITSIREAILKELPQVRINENLKEKPKISEEDKQAIAFYKTNGEKLYKLADAYHQALRKQFVPLMRLGHRHAENFPEKDLRDRLHKTARLAYQQYQQCYLIADAIQHTEERIQARRLAALALALGDRDLVTYAQLHLISALRIARCIGEDASFSDPAITEMNAHMEGLLENIIEVNNRAIAFESPRVDEKHIPAKVNPPASKALGVSIDPLRQALVEFKEKRNRTALNKLDYAVQEQLNRTTILIFPNSQFTKFKIDPEKITRAMMDVRAKRVAAGALTAGAIGTIAATAAATTVSAAEIYAISAAGGAIGGPIGMVVGVGIATLIVAGMALYGAYSLRKKAKEKTTQINQSDFFNNCVQEALAELRNQDYIKFLEKLAVVFNPNEEIEVNKIRLLTFERENKRFNIETARTIHLMLDCGFRPDGVVYILSLVAAIIVSPHITKESGYIQDRQADARRILQAICSNQELVKAAHALDKQTSDYRESKNVNDSIWQSFKNLFPSRHSPISQEWIEFAAQMRTIDRLELLKNNARINLIILYCLNDPTGKDPDPVRVLYKELSQSLKKFNPHLLLEIEERLKILHDFMRVYGFNAPTEAEAPLHPSNLLLPAPKEAAQDITTIHLAMLNKSSYSCKVTQVYHDTDRDFAAINLQLTQLGGPPVTRKSFAEEVRNAYEKKPSDEKMKALIKPVIRHERTADIQEWFEVFKNSKQKLNEIYFPILSKIYNIDLYVFMVVMQSSQELTFVGQKVNPILDSKTIPAPIHLAHINKDAIDAATAALRVDTLEYWNYISHVLNSPQPIAKSVKASLYVLRAKYYEDQARGKKKEITPLEALHYWTHVKDNYERALKETPNDPTICLQYADCLFELSKYAAVSSLLIEKYKLLKDNPRYFLLRGRLERKIGSYEYAGIDLVTASSLSREDKIVNQEVKTEMSILERLTQEPALPKKMKTNTDVQQYVTYQKARTLEVLTAARVKENPYWNILSLDGGGIRGILPALWLSELEARTRKPAAKLFQQISGTSTGAILGAGLAIPDAKDTQQITPQYRAAEILELYTSKSEQIFTDRSWLGAPRYSDRGRKQLFTDYFSKTNLSDALVELDITSVCEDFLLETFLFSRSMARQHPLFDYKFVDVLMATSAAPTYFSAYRIGNRTFHDGGVQVNNPASLAYTKARVYNVQNKDVFMLSLGTGDFVPGLLSPNLDRGYIFYGYHLKDVVFPGLPGNVDKEMHALLGDDYHRWQVFFDEEIGLDGCKQEQISHLIETGRSYLAEMYESGGMNALLEHFDDSALSPDDAPSTVEKDLNQPKSQADQKYAPKSPAVPTDLKREDKKTFAPASAPTTINPHGSSKLSQQLLAALTEKWELEQVLKTSLEEQKKAVNEDINKAAKSYGYACRDVAHDGNCFFHAVKDQLIVHKVMLYKDYSHQQLRELAVNHILQNFNHYKDSIEGDLNSFIERMAKDKTWADHQIVLALSRCLNVNLVIIQSDQANPIIIRQVNPIATLELGYEVNRHYRSLIRQRGLIATKSITITDAAPDPLNSLIPIDNQFYTAGVANILNQLGIFHGGQPVLADGKKVFTPQSKFLVGIVSDYLFFKFEKNKTPTKKDDSDMSMEIQRLRN